MVADASPGLERLSWREIRARFPDQWVVLVDADWVDHHVALSTARVFAHRKRRREVSADLGAACGEFANVACFFTGEIRLPEHVGLG